MVNSKKNDKHKRRRKHAQRLINAGNPKKSSRQRIGFIATFTIGLFMGILYLTEHTLIHTSLLVFSWLLIGMLGAFAFPKTIKNYAQNSYWVGSWLVSCFSFGSLIICSLLFLNWFFTHPPLGIEKVEILESEVTKSRGRCSSHDASVVVKGYHKTIKFPCSTDLDSFSYVELTLAKGLCGFETIRRSRLMD